MIKDAFKLNMNFNDLINKVSKKVVSKSKFSHLIAEELANLKLKFNKKNSTRWNSILFMVRSVLKVTREQFQDIQNKMPTATKEQHRVKKDFML